MIFLRRRRPIARAAVVGGAAYAVGRNAANNSAREEEQEDRINQLENENAQGQKGGTASYTAPSTTDITASLKELSSLKASGALTDEEYEAAKKKLLA